MALQSHTAAASVGSLVQGSTQAQVRTVQAAEADGPVPGLHNIISAT